ncbi:MAG: calcium/sodium antiporter [archaeon]
MIIEIILFILGLILLVKGSDFFVKSAATLAKRLGISEFIIGMTLVALGTSLPELASGIAASLKQNSGLILGNIVGSNLENTGLIIGIGAIMMNGIRTKKKLMKRDGYIMVAVGILFLIFIINKTLGRWEAAIFLLIYCTYTIYLLQAKVPTREKEPFMDFIKYFFKLQYLTTIRSRVMTDIKHIEEGLNHTKKKVTKSEAKQITNLFTASLIKDLLIMAISGVAIYFGAKYLILEAVYFANLLKVPTTLIGLTVVSLGTTLPELSVTISAARKKYGGIIIGNLLGSNITNILLILGVSAMIHPLAVMKETLNIAVPLMVAMSILLMVLMRHKWELTRTNGITLIGFYIISLAIMFFTYV